MCMFRLLPDLLLTLYYYWHKTINVDEEYTLLPLPSVSRQAYKCCCSDQGFSTNSTELCSTLLLNLFTKFVYCGSHPTETELYSGRDQAWWHSPRLPRTISSSVDKILLLGHPFLSHLAHVVVLLQNGGFWILESSSRFGFCSDKLSLHRKTNIIQILMTKTYYFYHGEVLKQDRYMTHFLSYTNTVSWCSHCKINRYVAATSGPYWLR